MSQSILEEPITIPESEITRKVEVFERDRVQLTVKRDISGRQPPIYAGKARGNLPVTDTQGRVGVDQNNRPILAMEWFDFVISVESKDEAKAMDEAYAKYKSVANTTYQSIMKRFLTQPPKIEVVSETAMPKVPTPTR